jgi:hypothetical protein
MRSPAAILLLVFIWSAMFASEPALQAVADLQSRRDAMIQAFKSDRAKTLELATLKVMGDRREVLVDVCNDRGVNCIVDGNQVILRWANLTDSDLCQLALKLCPDDAQTLFNAGGLAVAMKNKELIQAFQDRLASIDAAKAAEFEKRVAR